MQTVMILIVVLALGLAACVGEEDQAALDGDEFPVGPTPVPVPPARLQVSGVGEDVAEALAFCAEGAQDWCAFAGPQLTNDQLIQIVETCNDGVDQACALSANLAGLGFAVRDAEENIVRSEPSAEAPDAIPPTTPTAIPPATQPTVTVPPAIPQAVELQSTGVMVGSEFFAFGATFEQLRPSLEAAVGSPTADTGILAIDAGCPAGGSTYRFVTYAGLELTILDESPYAGGFAHVAAWLAFHDLPAGVSPVAYLGDAPGSSIVPGGTTVSDLTLQFGSEVLISDEPEFGPTYALEDGGGRLFGFLDGVMPDDRVSSVLGGQGCGE